MAKPEILPSTETPIEEETSSTVPLEQVSESNNNTDSPVSAEHEKEITTQLYKATQEKDYKALKIAIAAAHAANMTTMIAELNKGGWIEWADRKEQEALRASLQTPTPTPAIISQQTYRQAMPVQNYNYQRRANTETVYVTSKGKKYHRAGCGYLRSSGGSMSISAAQSSGYSACSRCF